VIDDKYLKEFATRAHKYGLQNHMAEHAIIVDVKPTYIVLPLSSLLKVEYSTTIMSNGLMKGGRRMQR